MRIRPCGDCTVCCKILEIPTIKKPPRNDCPNLCSKGCGVYESRPDECKSFQCIWSEGFSGDGQRPDKSGIFAYGLDTQYGRTLLILETKEKAFIRRKNYKDKLIKLAEKKKMVIIISDFHGDSIAMVP